MSKDLKRHIKENQIVYVVDFWKYKEGSRACAVKAIIALVNQNTEEFVVVLHGYTYNRYKFDDFDKLVFRSQVAAELAASEIPAPNSTIYQIINKKVYEKKVTGVTGARLNGTNKLFIEFNIGEKVLISELGQTLFKTREEAEKMLKKDVSINVNDGGRLAFIGHNDEEKTTLAKLITGKHVVDENPGN